MNANELRIGNYFLESYEGYKIIAGINHHNDLPITVDAHAIGRKICGRYDLDAMQPILLTEDILLNCGFVREHYMYHLLLNKADDIILKKELRLDIDGDEWFADIVEYYDDDEVGEYSINIAKVKHIHQLQNLFFCLCGKELTIKL